MIIRTQNQQTPHPVQSLAFPFRPTIVTPNQLGYILDMDSECSDSSCLTCRD